MAEIDTDAHEAAHANAVEPETPSFDDIKDDIQFTGFTDAQRDTILGQLEQAYETESGRAMIDDGLARNGLHYFNSNSQAVAQGLVDDITAQFGPGANIEDYLRGDFALPSGFPVNGRQGQVFLSAYPSIDPATGQPEIYNIPGSALNGQAANATAPIKSLDQDGQVVELDSTYVMIHETNHIARDSRDIVDDPADGPNNDIPNGKYYTGAYITDPTQQADYLGRNETETQVVMREMGYTDLRGSYIGTFIQGRTTGEDFGLDREYDTTLTSGGNIDMTAHAPQDALVVNTDGSGIMRLGDGNDTAHGLGGRDGFVLGGGDDLGYGGLGDDVFLGGRGNDYYDGGEAGVDPAALSSQSENTTDWGFDFVDYSTLDVGGGPAGILTAEFSEDGIARDGVFIEVNGRDIAVEKGSEAGSTIEQTDNLHNIDAVRGTSRDDLTVVESLDGDVIVDGAGGNDTLRIDTLPSGDVTNVVGAGTFNGRNYDGYITDGTARLYYNDYETIEVSTDASDEVDLTAMNTGATPGADVTDVDASSGVVPATVNLSLEEATIILRDEGLAAAEQSGAGSELREMLETPAAQSVMETLVENDQTTLEIDAAALEGDSASRVQAVLQGATSRLEEIDKVEDAHTRFDQLRAEQLSEFENMHHHPHEHIHGHEDTHEFDASAA